MLVAIDENRVNLTCLYLVNYGKIVVTILLSFHLTNVKFSVISLTEGCLSRRAQLHCFSSPSKGELLFPPLSQWNSAWEKRPDTQRAVLLEEREGWSGKISEYMSFELLQSGKCHYCVTNLISKKRPSNERVCYSFWLTGCYLFQPESLQH